MLLVTEGHSKRDNYIQSIMKPQQRMHRALILALSTMIFTCELEQAETLNASCISPQCRCYVKQSIFTATCMMKDLADLKYYIKRPTEIHVLDLSSGGISDVPAGIFVNFTKLQNLSLASNDIQILESGAFRGLENLLLLNISFNPLKTWQGNVYDDMTSLKQVDVTGNNQWVPSTNVMQLTSLTEIIGASWNEHCSGCSLVKSVIFHANYSQPRCTRAEDITQGTCTECLPVKCVCTRHSFSNQSIGFARHGFVFAKCSHLRKCQNSLSAKHLDDPCVRKNVVLLSIIQYPIGFIGIILNLVTVFHILTTKSLRNNVSMLLLSNMALCDLSSCLDAVIITTVLLAVPYDVFLDNVRSICLPLGLLWFVGICGSTIVSSLLTSERYFAIVFAMKPKIRMRQKWAVICLLITWAIVLSLATYSLAEELSTHNSFCIPGAATNESPKHLKFIIPIGIIGMMLFVLNIFLYIHIYIVVRRSQQNMGIKRETKTAKRIAVLVFTNMMFFFVPILMTGLLVISDTYPSIQLDGKGEIWRMVVTLYFPVVCFNLNSCINPLWYAFRNKKFKERLKERLVYLWSQLLSSRRRIGVYCGQKQTQNTYESGL